MRRGRLIHVKGVNASWSGGDLKTYMPWRRDVALRGTESTISFGGVTLAIVAGHCIAGWSWRWRATYGIAAQSGDAE